MFAADLGEVVDLVAAGRLKSDLHSSSRLRAILSLRLTSKVPSRTGRRSTDCWSLQRSASCVSSRHLGLVEEAYRAAETARLGPVGTSDDIIGPDGYRTHLMFQAGMPELRNDPRFARLCARLGLVEFWMATGKWPDCADEVPYDFKAECAKAQPIPKEDFGIRPTVREE